MKIRNAQYKNKENTIVDCEINHHTFGWIPYTFKFDEEDESFDSEVREYLKTADILPFKENIDMTLLIKIQENKEYLANTDFKMTVDYYNILTDEEKVELTTKRAEARAFLKAQGL